MKAKHQKRKIDTKEREIIQGGKKNLKKEHGNYDQYTPRELKGYSTSEWDSVPEMSLKRSSKSSNRDPKFTLLIMSLKA